MDYKEIETKYPANEIKIADFRSLALSLNPVSSKRAASYDHYFEKVKNDFIRYRAGERPELTRKFKMKDSDNFIRVEINVLLDPNMLEDTRLAVCSKFCDSLDFKPNFSIFKTCEIYFYQKFNVVYYIVYDMELNEQIRFIEIEMDENYPWPSEAAAWKELLKIEKSFKKIGITPNKRIKESLYEMFRKP